MKANTYKSFISRIEQLPLREQELLFRKAAHFISSRDTMHVIQLISQGATVFEAHLRLGLFHRYEADFLRILGES